MIKEIGSSHLGGKHISVRMWETHVNSAIREFKEHRHLNFEIALVLNGSGIYHTPKGAQTISMGNIFIFASNEPHYITEIGPDGLVILTLQFSHDLIERNPLLDEKFPLIFYAHSTEFCNRIPNDSGIADRLQRIREEFVQKQNGYQCVITTLISEIFILLIRHYGYCSPDAGSYRQTQRLEKAIDYINNHYCEKIFLSQVAKQCNITPNYFSALFRDYLNMNAWDYITSKRIEKAKRLLLDTNRNLNILEIANQCGYSNTANFNRAFKLYTGITPTQYRNGNYIDLV